MKEKQVTSRSPVPLTCFRSAEDGAYEVLHAFWKFMDSQDLPTCGPISICGRVFEEPIVSQNSAEESK